MCGIVGYIGKKDAFPILIKGLRRLEYRGYDSAGVALINTDGELNVYHRGMPIPITRSRTTWLLSTTESSKIMPISRRN